VELGIFDAAGRRVRTLVSGAASAGQHPVVWDLNDDRGAPAGAGLFFARLEAEGQRFTARFVTLR
jgi:flagellar hook assembly protein FlgD